MYNRVCVSVVYQLKSSFTRLGDAKHNSTTIPNHFRANVNRIYHYWPTRISKSIFAINAHNNFETTETLPLTTLDVARHLQTSTKIVSTAKKLRPRSSHLYSKSFIMFLLSNFWFGFNLPRARHMPETDEHQISAHLQPTPEGRQFRAFHFLPVDGHFGDGNLQSLGDVQQFHVESPSLNV